MKTYYITRRNDGVVICEADETGKRVRFDDGGLNRYRVPHCVMHSPTGFESGYGGSGPADLALSILADFLGVWPEQIKAVNERALTLSVQDRKHLPIRLHQLFKADYIAGSKRRLEPGESYSIKGDEIARWIERNKAAHGRRHL